MKKIRIGNDLPIAWTVVRCGTPEDFSGKSLALYLTNRYGRIQVTEFNVKDNIIEFIYPGKVQRHAGEYGLLLIENDDLNGMNTVDVGRAFMLIPSGGCMCDCDSEVHLLSDIAIPANGLSAYEIAVLHGYIGTEEEWLKQMSNLPLKPGTGRGSLMHVQAAEASGSNSFAEGDGTTAAGSGSHAEGKDSGTSTSAHHAHAEGLRTHASQQQAHSEGAETSADGTQAHAEGYYTHANGHRSHAEGQQTRAEGKGAHAEGYATVARGEYSHSEGNSTVAEGASSHAEGFQTNTKSPGSHAEGRETTASGTNTHAEGFKTKAAGYSSHAEGQETEATAPQSHAEGLQTLASGDRSHAEGYKTVTKNRAEHAEGTFNLSIPDKTIHTVGIGLGEDSRMNAEEIHTDGKQYIIGVGGYDGTNSEASKALQEVLTNFVDLLSDQTIKGAKIFTAALIFKAGLSMSGTRIRKVGTPKDDDDAATKGYVDGLIDNLGVNLEKGTGDGAVKQSTVNEASGKYSAAFGERTKATAIASFAEGSGSISSGPASHAEGDNSKAYGYGSHAEGIGTNVNGVASHTEGYSTETKNDYEHAQGLFNRSVQGKTIHSVGIGLGDGNSRKNAEEIHKDGNKYIIGIGGYDGTNSTTEGTKSVQEVISNLVDKIKALEDALSQSLPSQV